MQCEICNKDIVKIVVLPIKQEDGKPETFVCEDCARKSGYYCKKHKKPHLGFDDGTHACTECIEELVTKKEQQKAEIHEKLRLALPEEEFQRLKMRAFIASGVTQTSPLTRIVIFIATKALREGVKFEDVMNKVIEEESVESILEV